MIHLQFEFSSCRLIFGHKIFCIVKVLIPGGGPARCGRSDKRVSEVAHGSFSIVVVCTQISEFSLKLI